MPDSKRIYYSSLCQHHQTSLGHPERPERLQAIVDYLQQNNHTKNWQWIEPKAIEQEWFTHAHPVEYVKAMFACLPTQDEPLIHLDGDTCWSSQSGTAISLAGGALKQAIDYSIENQWTQIPISFCLNRPPGHHAERKRAMGFCIFSLIACAAIYAQQQHQLERIAILDFDVHHGNGTEDVLQDHPTLFFASSYEQHIFPAGTIAQKTQYRRCLPIQAQTENKVFLERWEKDIFTALNDYQPQMILVSAGFDAHQADPLANCNLDSEAFTHLGKRMMEIAKQHDAPIIANLEGGYNLEALAQSTHAFLKGLE